MITFSASSQMVEFDVIGLPNIDSPKSISLWYTVSTLGGVQSFLNLVGSSAGVQLGIRGGVLSIWGFGGGVLVSTATAINVYSLLVYTFDGSTHRLYNNASLGSSSTVIAQTGPITSLTLGNNVWSEYMQGALEDIRVYNRVLNQNEIQNIYALNGKDYMFDGLVAKINANIEAALVKEYTTFNRNAIVSGTPGFLQGIYNSTKRIIAA